MSQGSHDGFRLQWFPVLLIAGGLSLTLLMRPIKPEGTRTEVPVSSTESAPSEAEEWVVGRIGDREISFGELETALQSLPVFARERYQSYERRRDFLEAYIQVFALAAYAAEEGYGKDPEVVERLKAEAVERYLQEQEDLWVRSADIPDQQVQEYYETHPEEFHRPAQGRFLQVVVRDRSLAERVLLRLRAAMEGVSVDPVRAFRQLAMRYREGNEEWAWDLGWRPNGDDRDLPPEVVQTIGRMREDWGWEGPVESNQGYHVIFRVASREALDQSLAQARPVILERLLTVRQAELRRSFLSRVREPLPTRVDRAEAERVVEAVRKEWQDREMERRALEGAVP